MYSGSQAFTPPTSATSHALADVKLAAIDLDGVVYRGNTMIEGAGIAISTMRQRGWRVVFASNTSVRTRTDIAAKLSGMGIPAEQDEVFTSAYLAGLLAKNLGLNKSALVIGGEGLRSEIAGAGATIVDSPPCGLLVVGMDPAFSYDKIRLAMEAIECDAVFIACNRDASFPSGDGRMLPGCGPIVAAIEAAAGCPPAYIAGKPSVLMLEAIAAKYSVAPTEILVVGDGLTSDIEMALAFGSPSVLIAPDTVDFTLGTTRPSFTVRSLVDVPGLLKGRTAL